jgi:hypothetical protein
MLRMRPKRAYAQHPWKFRKYVAVINQRPTPKLQAGNFTATRWAVFDSKASDVNVMIREAPEVFVL